MLNTKVVDTHIVCSINDIDKFKELVNKHLDMLIPDKTNITKSFIDESIEFIIKTILLNKITNLEIQTDQPYLLKLHTNNIEYRYVVAKYSDDRIGKGFSICETLTD